MTAIGIDFGDKISSAAILRDGRAELVPSGETGIFGDKSFPSCVALTFDDRILVGEPARRQAADNPTGTATGFKWLMARHQFLMLRKRAFSSERLTTFLFEKIKGDGEIFARTRIEAAVVGVPPDFEQVQRQALVEAAQIAGFSDVSLIEEPCAAAVACGLDRHVPKSESVRSLVVDFGGSGLAISVLEHRAGELRPISSSRWAELSGTAMDEAVFRSLEQEFKAETGHIVSQDAKASVRLRQAAEIARIELNEGRTATIVLPVLVGLGEESRHAELTLTRAELDRLIAPLLSRCRQAVGDALRRAELGSGDIGHLVLAGGLMRMTQVRAVFEDLFGRQAEKGVDPAYSVAIGAAYKAASLEAVRLRNG